MLLLVMSIGCSEAGVESKWLEAEGISLWGFDLLRQTHMVKGKTPEADLG